MNTMTTMENPAVNEKDEQIIAVFDELRSIPAVIEQLQDVSATRIKETLEEYRHLSISRFPKRKAVSKSEIVDALRAAAEEGATSVDRYSEFRATRPNLPSAQTIILRFGSWSAAQAEAGLSVRRRVSRASLRSYDDETIVAALEDFVNYAVVERAKPTQKLYDSWARARRDIGIDTPLLSTIRARCVDYTWNELMRQPAALRNAW